MYDITIIGCGVVGAALAYELSRYDLKVLVLEKENDVATGTTKANSAIVHAGYDPEPGTLMAKLNVQGSEMMEELCRSLDVKYARTGSLVLAFSEEDKKHLRQLYSNGVENGVPDMSIISGDEARSLEPHLSPDVWAALLAPSAAIIEPWGLCIALAETAVNNGVTLKLRSEVKAIKECENGLSICTDTGDYDTKYAVNCAGCCGHEICEMTGVSEWESLLSRGEYYLLDKSSGDLVHRIIFQTPTATGKGVLVAPTVHGNLIVGPSAESVDSPYSRETTAEGLDKVALSAMRSVEKIDLRQNIRNFSGIRANTSESDFIIRPAKGCERMLHVAGIKSPGLSAAPAIAKYAVELLQDMGVTLSLKAEWNGTRKQIRFQELSQREKKHLINQNEQYGRVICRCETITEGEIVAAIHSPIPPCSLDGIKRRTAAGAGRCQGGFCGPRVLDILARELGCDPQEILQDHDGTFILTGKTKGGSMA